jgi:hypothetical protein
MFLADKKLPLERRRYCVYMTENHSHSISTSAKVDQRILTLPEDAPREDPREEDQYVIDSEMEIRKDRSKHAWTNCYNEISQKVSKRGWLIE